MKIFGKYGVGLVVLFLVIGVAPLDAASPETMIYHGQAVDSTGNGLEGVHRLRIAYYQPGKTKAVLREEIPGVLFSDGRFEIKLGGGVPLKGSSISSLVGLFSTYPEIEMEISMDGELQEPRVLIQPAGFSRADKDGYRFGTRTEQFGTSSSDALQYRDYRL
ncbi:MAG: hypothetical protein K8R59_13350 [Thermoanaerobaculales bacterium]|nr:hypothetical protein [Thermoanaerobaculales bacterium]